MNQSKASESGSKMGNSEDRADILEIWNSSSAASLDKHIFNFAEKLTASLTERLDQENGRLEGERDALALKLKFSEMATRAHEVWQKQAESRVSSLTEALREVMNLTEGLTEGWLLSKIRSVARAALTGATIPEGEREHDTPGYSGWDV
jgi:hypothetical protein